MTLGKLGHGNLMRSMSTFLGKIISANYAVDKERFNLP